MRIGITGKARSGKDTVARYLTSICKDMPVYSLASPIKKVLNEMFGWDERHADGKLKEIPCDIRYIDVEEFARKVQTEYKVTYKRAYQATVDFVSILQAMYGVRVFYYNSPHVSLYNLSPRVAYQVWGTDVWRNQLYGSPEFWIDMVPQNCILADVRYDNEAAICDHVIKLERDELGDGVVAKHASEAGVSEEYISATIKNNGTVEELINMVSAYVYVKAIVDHD